MSRSMPKPTNPTDRAEPPHASRPAPQTRPADLAGLIDELTRSGARLDATLSELGDAEVRAPSRLPGWNRGQVLAHVACSAEAYTWLLAVARNGVGPGPRLGREALARAVAEAAVRPADALAAELRSALARLVADARAMPAEAWDTRVTALAGWAHPAWYTLYRCWRELETHHVDLDAGYRTAHWPAAYVTWALDGTLAALAARDFPVARVEAVDLGRTWHVARSAGPAVAAPGHVLLGWLSGRATDTTVVVTGAGPGGPSAGEPTAEGAAAGVAMPVGRLPVPPVWPLPPAPGWDDAGDPVA
ncbi:maleylpyruvate isomerase family mycothiol-dependent enzyme [Streptomyces sp. RGM 3693]|uniref:maleylpyruvate isomerase family mycothiol-dependent enzyme n=1 Tax=Streptomyces sp. RGM 3693 TaxID=3413284 RepID=UPI003D2B6514